MKRAVIIALFMSFTASAWAACPAGTSYNCTTTYNGKQSCGCR